MWHSITHVHAISNPYKHTLIHMHPLTNSLANTLSHSLIHSDKAHAHLHSRHAESVLRSQFLALQEVATGLGMRPWRSGSPWKGFGIRQQFLYGVYILRRIQSFTYTNIHYYRCRHLYAHMHCVHTINVSTHREIRSNCPDVNLHLIGLQSLG